MKRTLFLTSLLACCLGYGQAATYTNLTESWCDEVNNVIYNGQGYFAVYSATNSTTLDLTINLDSLVSYVNSNDYAGSSYMLVWENNIQNYGLGDNADTSTASGRTPYLSGWVNGAWNASSNNVSYSTLQQYADLNGNITLSITNSSTGGVTVAAKDSSGTSQNIYTAGGLKYGSMNTVTGYYVNLNYVTSVTLNTSSTLDTDSYVPPPDYTVPFESQRTDGTSIGRVTFLGDSITHGVNDQSYRWQFFKVLTDNGIENEIVGPRSGYYNAPTHTEDAGSSYGGAEFANVHLAQASGRTHNIISGSNSGMSGVNYGGHSTASTAESFDSNSWFCMMGTNDLLSDTKDPVAGSTYATQMQKMLGGEVTYNAAEDCYNWQAGESWGNMGQIVSDVYTEGDTFYMLSITPWGGHNNHNNDSDHYAAAEFNRLLEGWSQAYTAETGKKVVYVDVTRGMVDRTSAKRNMSHDAFFNSSSDRLHPNDQGSLLMAGNLARAMGIGGRTAGLERQSSAGWSGQTVGEVYNGTGILAAENAFTMSDGYTVDLSAEFGNGAADGWLGADCALSISLGDGTNSGTLNLSEGYIMWGSEVLFCWDNSTLADEGNLRIVWHNGNAADNVLSGYYVWLGDMLIGQGLSATTDTGLNGILISANGADGTITDLTWANQAYAPTTLGMVSAENAYITTQDAASVTQMVSNTFSYTVCGKDFTGATESSLATNSLVSSAESPKTVKLTSSTGWVGMTNIANSGEVNVQLTGNVTNTVFAAMGNATNGNLTLEVVEGSSIGGGVYSGQTAAIAGSYGGGDAESFHLFMNGGTVGGDIVGGSINGNGVISDVRLVINDGTVNGNVIGGSKVDDGSVGTASIYVTGGKIDGNINAGGDAGSIGSTNVVITGGEITGDITKGTATRRAGAVAGVTVEGNSAKIGGNITADRVTLRNVSDSGTDGGFDTYAGMITAERLTLDNVKVNLQATISDNISIIEVTNGSDTGAALGATFTLSKLLLTDGATFSAYQQMAAAGALTSAQETTLNITTLEAGVGATLNANLVFGADSVLILKGALNMGSDVALSSGMELNLYDSMLAQLYGYEDVVLFDGVDNLMLDGKQLADGEVINANGVFDNLDLAYDYTLSYEDGVVSIKVIPEPATATLSLLALAALAARRRRR